MYPGNSIHPDDFPPGYEEATQGGYYSNTQTAIPSRLQPLPLIHSAPPQYDIPQTGFVQAELSRVEIPLPVDAANSSAENFTVGATFQEKSVRKKFIKKVFGILCLQLLATVAIVCLFTFIQPIRDFMASRLYLVFVAGLVVLFLYLFIGFNKSIQRQSPRNLAVICVMTLAMSVFAGTIASFFSTEAVVFAFVMSCGVCFLVCFLSWTTRLDASGWCGFFIIMWLVFLWFGFVSLCTYQQIWYIQVVYGFIGAIVFAMFLSYDINKILGKDDEYDPEDYVLACITIYTDIVMVFVFILVLIGGGGAGG